MPNVDAKGRKRGKTADQIITIFFDKGADEIRRLYKDGEISDAVLRAAAKKLGEENAKKISVLREELSGKREKGSSGLLERRRVVADRRTGDGDGPSIIGAFAVDASGRRGVWNIDAETDAEGNVIAFRLTRDTEAAVPARKPRQKKNAAPAPTSEGTQPAA